MSIFKIVYDLYKDLYSLRLSIPRQDRYGLWQRAENLCLDILEGVMKASELYKAEKIPVLEMVSTKLNLLRIFIRLSFDVKMINGKQYTRTQQRIDEIGRMLGGWIRKYKKEQQEHVNEEIPAVEQASVSFTEKTPI